MSTSRNLLACTLALTLASAARAQPNPYNPLGAGFNPYVPSGGASMGAATLPNPFPPNPPFNPYFPYFPGMFNPIGGILSGQADLVSAYGTVIGQQEQARILREQAMQAKIDTERKRFDHNMYIRANTPTYTQEQAKIAATTLKRIQTMSTATEIANGRALNILLDDIRKLPTKKAALDPLPVSEDVLRSLNIVKGAGNVGLLRGEGAFLWPLGMLDVLTPEEQKKVEQTAQAAMTKASKGHIDQNLIRDLNAELAMVRDKLNRKATALSAPQLVECKRFLADFEEAAIGLEKGEASVNVQYQKFISGGKTVQDLSDYLISNGLRFAAASPGDEAAYRALYASMVQFDVFLNAQFGIASAEGFPMANP